MPTTVQTFDPNQLQPSSFPGDARTVAAQFGINQTLAKGTVLAKKTTDGLMYAYSDVTTSLTTAVGVLACAIKTDANGKIYMSTTSSTAAIDNKPGLTAPVFVHGTFFTTDLTGYDAAALTDLKGRTLPSGEIQF